MRSRTPEKISTSSLFSVTVLKVEFESEQIDLAVSTDLNSEIICLLMSCAVILMVWQLLQKY